MTRRPCALVRRKLGRLPHFRNFDLAIGRTAAQRRLEVPRCGDTKRPPD
jgi:hypothetical protein